MRLTKEHIGKSVVGRDGGRYKVKAVDEDSVWLEQGGDYDTWTNHDDWIIEEPKKKPSERIREISTNMAQTQSYSQEMMALLSYLDEEFEKGK